MCCDDCVCGSVELPDNRVFNKANYPIVCNDCCDREQLRARIKKQIAEQEALKAERKRLGLDPA
jgi:hypothetical protein